MSGLIIKAGHFEPLQEVLSTHFHWLDQRDKGHGIVKYSYDEQFSTHSVLSYSFLQFLA